MGAPRALVRPSTLPTLPQTPVRTYTQDMRGRISLLITFIFVMGLLTPITPANAFASSKKTVSKLSSCPRYVFLGMRGSGQELEPGSDVGVFGPELASLLSELKKIPAFVGNLESDYPDAASYKALGVGLTSEYIGEVRNEAPLALTELFASHTKRCGSDTKFILAGYSQGAYAVHELVSMLEKNKARPELKNRVLAAIALANPGNPETGLMAYLEKFKSSQVGRDVKNILFLCAWATRTIRKDCEAYWAFIAKEAVNDVLPYPKVIPMYSYHREQDLVADIGSNKSFKLLLEESRRNYFSYLYDRYKSTKVIWDVGAMTKKHTSYCPKSGPFSKSLLEKIGSAFSLLWESPVEKFGIVYRLSTCSDSTNAIFVKRATKHVIDQLAKEK